jgi:YtxH-like protein
MRLRENGAKKWARIALKTGLLLTDAKLWSSLTDQMRDRMDDVSDSARDRYEETSGRIQDARDALRGKSDWVTPILNFVGGVGIGIGIGMLFAPVSGEEARAALRDKVVEMKDKVSDMTSGSAGYRSSSMSSATGTD